MAALAPGEAPSLARPRRSGGGRRGGRRSSPPERRCETDSHKPSSPEHLSRGREAQPFLTRSLLPPALHTGRRLAPPRTLACHCARPALMASSLLWEAARDLLCLAGCRGVPPPLALLLHLNPASTPVTPSPRSAPPTAFHLPSTPLPLIPASLEHFIPSLAAAGSSPTPAPFHLAVLPGPCTRSPASSLNLTLEPRTLLIYSALSHTLFTGALHYLPIYTSLSTPSYTLHQLHRPIHPGLPYSPP